MIVCMRVHVEFERKFGEPRHGTIYNLLTYRGALPPQTCSHGSWEGGGCWPILQTLPCLKKLGLATAARQRLGGPAAVADFAVAVAVGKMFG